jgi:hypothetical protein
MLIGGLLVATSGWAIVTNIRQGKMTIPPTQTEWQTEPRLFAVLLMVQGLIFAAGIYVAIGVNPFADMYLNTSNMVSIAEDQSPKLKAGSWREVGTETTPRTRGWADVRTSNTTHCYGAKSIFPRDVGACTSRSLSRAQSGAYLAESECAPDGPTITSRLTYRGDLQADFTVKGWVNFNDTGYPGLGQRTDVSSRFQYAGPCPIAGAPES